MNPFANEKFRASLYGIFASLGVLFEVFGADNRAVQAALGVVMSLLLFLALLNVPEFRAWIKSFRNDPPEG